MRAAKVTVAAFVLAGIVGVGAQAPTFKRTVLQQADLSVSGREAVTAIAELQPNGGSPGRHSHPGEEIGYILEGKIVVQLDGKPAVALNTGQAFLIPAGAIHNATNTGSTTARVLATYIVEKGKPLATPAATK